MTSPRVRSQAGFNLIEVLVAIVLISILVMAMARGMLTSITVDNSTQDRQRRSAALASFVAAVEELPYRECADADWYWELYEDAREGVVKERLGADGQPILDEHGEPTYEPDPVAQQERFGLVPQAELSVTSVEYWSAGAFAVDGEGTRYGWSNGDFVTECVTDEGTQRLTLEVEYRGISTSTVLVKRNPSGMRFDQLMAPTTIPWSEQAPEASFRMEAGDTPGSTRFVSTSSAYPPRTLVEERWDFDGAFATAVFGPGQIGLPAAQPQHAFPPGVFKVTLTVTDSEGEKAFARATVSATGKPAQMAPPRLLSRDQVGLTGLFTGIRGTFTFGWTPLPGVQEYQLRVRYCGMSIINLCDWVNTSWEYRSFGAVTSGTINRDANCLPWHYEAQIRARVGSEYGDWSDTTRQEFGWNWPWNC